MTEQTETPSPYGAMEQGPQAAAPKPTPAPPLDPDTARRIRQQLADETAAMHKLYGAPRG